MNLHVWRLQSQNKWLYVDLDWNWIFFCPGIVYLDLLYRSWIFLWLSLPIFLNKTIPNLKTMKHIQWLILKATQKLAKHKCKKNYTSILNTIKNLQHIIHERSNFVMRLAASICQNSRGKKVCIQTICIIIISTHLDSWKFNLSIWWLK